MVAMGAALNVSLNYYYWMKPFPDGLAPIFQEIFNIIKMSMTQGTTVLTKLKQKAKVGIRMHTKAMY